MSNVTLSIAGRTYRIGCAAGEEQHISMLGSEIDAKLASNPGIASQSEPHTLLYAALLMADELHEARKNAGQVKTAPQSSSNIASPLEIMADRLESLASRLEGESTSS